MAYALLLDNDMKDSKGLPQIAGFGRYEIKVSIWKQINDFMNNVDLNPNGFESDPFTDIDSGYYFVVNKQKKEYRVTVINKSYPIPDDFLKQFENLDRLEDVLSYREQDWEKQLEGLRNIDEDYEVGLFDSDEFQAIIAEIRIQLDEIMSGGSRQESSRNTVSRNKENVAEAAQESEEEQVEAVNKEIKAFVNEHPEFASQLRLKKSMNAAQRRSLLIEAQQALADLDVEQDQEEDDDDDELFED
jgi:hypothetical protein